MSCRSNPGNSMATSLARVSSGLSDVQTLSLFHRLVREGAGQPQPTPQQVQDWLQEITAQIAADTSLAESQRRSLLERAERIAQMPLPNGATFFAWQSMLPRARESRAALNSAYEQLAPQLGLSSQQVAEQANTLAREALASSRQLRPPAQFVENFAQDASTNFGSSANQLPQDRATLYALYTLSQQVQPQTNPPNAGGMGEPPIIPPPPPAPPILREEVDSSFIDALSYNQATRQLQVEFSNGSVYQYEGVPPYIYNDLLQPGQSVGRAYGYLVRGQYPSSRITEPGAWFSYQRATSAQLEAARTQLAPQLTEQRRASQQAQAQTSAGAAVLEPPNPSRAMTEAEAIAQAAFANPTPIARSYTQEMNLFQQAYEAAKARKANGEAAIAYLRENATGGLGRRDGGRGFGIEMEFDLSGVADRWGALEAIGRELHTAGLTTSPRQQGYHSSSNYSRWRFEHDSTVDGEIISPILYDEPQSWDQIQKVCDIVRSHGGKATARTGGHVHVACANYDHTPANHNNLLKLFKQNEDVLYRLAQNPDRPKHRGVRWCTPNHLPSADYASVDEVRRHHSSHGLGLNFQSVNGSATDHVEFRMWDGSLDPSVIQTQIKLSLALTEAAFREGAGAGAATGAQPSGGAAGTGTHRGSSQAQAQAELLGTHRRINQNQNQNQATPTAAATAPAATRGAATSSTTTSPAVPAGTSNSGGGGRQRRLTGEAWVADTQSFRGLVDRLFSREEDKEQATALFALTKWQGR